MKIALLSPKGPLYRARGGIFKKSLRYQPLTLTTLAALIPQDLEPIISVYDEGIEPIPEVLDADLIGITVITGTARRSYQLSAIYRAQARPWCWVDHMSRCCPSRPPSMRTAFAWATPRIAGRSCCATSPRSPQERLLSETQFQSRSSRYALPAARSVQS